MVKQHSEFVITTTDSVNYCPVSSGIGTKVRALDGAALTKQRSIKLSDRYEKVSEYDGKTTDYDGKGSPGVNMDKIYENAQPKPPEADLGSVGDNQ